MSVLEEKPAVALFFGVTPTAKGRPRVATIGGRARVYTPKKTSDAEAEIRKIAGNHACAHPEWPLKGALEVRIGVFLPAPKTKQDRVGKPHLMRPDLDNFAKLILDSLNGILYVDDSQVWLCTVEKRWAKNGMIVVKYREEL